MQNPVVFENAIIVLVCVLAAIPVTFVLFRVLKSNAHYKAEGWLLMEPHGSGGADIIPSATDVARLGTNKNRKKNRVLIGGAAAGFLLAFTLAFFGLHRSYHTDYLLDEEWLSGLWDVLNDAEPEKLARWKFAKNANEEIVLTGDVWGISDITQPTRISEHELLGSFGPFDVSLTPRSGLEFDYESDFGDGSATFALAFGFLGSYTDDPAKTPPEHLDSGSILLHKGRIDPEIYRLRSIFYASALMMFYAWISAGIAYFLFRYLESHAQVKTGRWVLSGAVAFYYVFFGTLATAGNLRFAQPTVSEVDLAGEWKMEYMENRDRYGFITIIDSKDGLAFTAALAAQAQNERRIRPRANTSKPTPITYDAKKRTLSFDYETNVGTGHATLRYSPVLVGRFGDRATVKVDEENMGGFVAVKTE